jgi:hypothetical protein
MQTPSLATTPDNGTPWVTTLAAIRAKSPCQPGWEKLLKTLGKTLADDEPLLLLLLLTTILESKGLDDTLWALRTITNHDREIRLLAVRYARRVQHLMTDPRSINALDVPEQFAKGEVDENVREAAGEVQKAELLRIISGGGY